MQVDANKVVGFVSEKMGVSPDEAQKALCITDRETVIELQSVRDKGRYQHIIEHDLDTGKVDLKKIAMALDIPENDLETFVEDDMIWVVCGSIPEGIVGEGPTADFATADFYREWYKEKVFPNGYVC